MFKTPYNKDQFPTQGEVNIGVSMTIPDQSLSIPEILRRYARGIPFSAGKEPIFYEDEEISNMFANYDKLDLEERHQLIMKNSKLIKEKRRELAIQEEAKKLQKIEADLLDRIEKSDRKNTVEK